MGYKTSTVTTAMTTNRTTLETILFTSARVRFLRNAAELIFALVIDAVLLLV